MAYNPADILDKNQLTEAQKARRENRDALRSKKAQKEAAAKRRQDKFLAHAKKRRAVLAVTIILFVVVVVMAVKAVSEFSTVEALKAEKEKLKAELQAKEEALKAELQQVDSDEYVENAARTDLHMIKEGETLYVIDSEEDE